MNIEKIKECPFKYKSETIDENKIEYEKIKIPRYTRYDGTISGGFERLDMYFNGELIHFGEEYKLPKRDVFWCDIRDKECIGEDKCPIMK